MKLLEVNQQLYTLQQVSLNKMNKKIVLAIGILLVLTLQTVSALGVTPGRRTIEYPDDLDKTFNFRVLNPEHKDMQLFFGTSGELGEYIVLDENSVEIDKTEDSKDFTYTLNAPLDLAPGKHIGEIIISEIGDEEGIGAVIAVKTELVFFVPYPSKYIESTVDIIESDKNETTVFLIPIINRGEEELEDVNAIIEIYKKGQKIDEIRTTSLSIDSMERKELIANWVANVPIGTYSAKITLDYDNEQIIFNKGFKVGTLSFEIFDVFVEDFELGNIVKLDILVENKWSERLKEVYADLILYDKNYKEVVSVRSPPKDVGPFEKTRIPLYWDTSNFITGEYKGKIIINYKEFSSERDIYVKISEYGIGIELESGEFVLGESPGFVKIFLIVLFLIVILFIILKKVIRRK